MRYTTPLLDLIEIDRASFTIQTKYLKPTDHRGSRIKAWLPSRKGFSISVSYFATAGDAHDNAAAEWFYKFHNKFSQLAISPWANKPNKIKLLKVATPTGFLYTLIK